MCDCLESHQASQASDQLKSGCQALSKPSLCCCVQVCREADGYQGHLVSPEFGLKRLIEDAMLLVLDPVITAVHRVHLLLVEAARWAPSL